MSSSPTKAWLAQTNPIGTMSLYPNPRQYQTVYDNGSDRCIVERRRRSRRVTETVVEARRGGPRSQTPASSTETLPELLTPLRTRSYPSSRSSSKSTSLARSRGASVAKAMTKTTVIITTHQMTQQRPKQDAAAPSRIQSEPTPPPTPRLERLPTPELSDLDEAPFCDCDKTALMTYCTSCKKAEYIDSSLSQTRYVSHL